MAESNPPGSPPDPFEMFRRLWAPLGLPVPGMAMPTLDPAEVEKRIADLKSVETWLGMNLNMVKMAIQGLEVQKMALNAMRANASAVSAASDAARAFAGQAAASAPPEPAGKSAMNPGVNPMANPMLWPWAMMQGGADAQATPPKPAASKVGNTKKGKNSS